MRILLLLVLLLLPAFFAAVEVALLRLRTSRVRVLDEQGVPVLTLCTVCSGECAGLC